MTTPTSKTEKQSAAATSGQSSSKPGSSSAQIVARKTRENVQEKGARLLIQGRLRVTRVEGDLVWAECRGDSGRIYKLGHWDEKWACSCPARTSCSHLIALWLVTVAG